MALIMKIIFTIAISICALTLKTITNNSHSYITTITMESPFNDANHLMPSKRVSRFLANVDKEKNPRAADHCNKDNAVCTLQGSYTKSNSTVCCNNKCIDLVNDDQNCGACKNKCKHTQSCCRGQCVYLAYDKRHCGKCNNKCPHGEYCVYGMCEYA
ncbi:hypothetical protein ACFE04_007337 [Oxalis oulophora]